MHPRQTTYPAAAREEVADLLPSGLASIMDIGCARGGFGGELRRRGWAGRLIGVEPSAEQAGDARSRGYDQVIEGFFPDDVGDDLQVDCVVFNDILEHMLDPWAGVRHSVKHLRPGGWIVASIPSIQYLPALLQVARGKWDYTDEGLLDRTHVRFFTRRTMVKMFEDEGFTVVACHGIHSFLAGRWRFLRPVQRIFGDTRFLHYVVIACIDRDSVE